MSAATSSNSTSNKACEGNANLLLENIEVASESETETKVVATSLSNHQELEASGAAMTLDGNSEGTETSSKSGTSKAPCLSSSTHLESIVSIAQKGSEHEQSTLLVSCLSC